MASTSMVQGLAVNPGTPYSLHLTEIRLPDVDQDSVQIRVLEAGICGTDREIIGSTFGSPPPGSPDLVLGHEFLGVIEAIGANVEGLKVGELVTATVRRGCGCPQCAAGESDYCTSMTYTERGIRGEHGFMTDRIVERAQHVIPVPSSLRAIGAMVEPASVVEKAWRVASAVQYRIPRWEPKTAVIYGAGPIGLLQAMMFRARGIDVYVLGRRSNETAPGAAIVEQIGGTYLSTGLHDGKRLRSELPNVDVVVECSGSSECVAESLELLGVAGVLVLLSNTGGSHEVTLPLDQINVRFVGGNKTMVGSVNSSAADFRNAIADMLTFEQLWPGVAAQMITHRLNGLGEGTGLMESTAGAIKAVIEVGA